MKAQDLQFTQGAKQFIIPIFQRTYSWNVGHCGSSLRAKEAYFSRGEQ